MIAYTRLSLESVTWTLRVTAILVGLLVALTLFAPISGLLAFLETGNAQTLAQITLRFFAPIFLLAWLALVPSGFAIFLYWLVPALILNHIALALRCRFYGFLVAGALTGILGFVFLWISNALSHDELNTLTDASRTVRGAVLRHGVPAAFTGAIAAAVAWGVMSLQLCLRTTENGESKTASGS